MAFVRRKLVQRIAIATVVALFTGRLQARFLFVELTFYHAGAVKDPDCAW
jgi:hypothetical protein